MNTDETITEQVPPLTDDELTDIAASIVGCRCLRLVVEVRRLRVIALAWRSIATVYRDSESGSEMTAAADAIKALDPAGWKDTFAAEPPEVIARMRAMCADARGEAPR